MSEASQAGTGAGSQTQRVRDAEAALVAQMAVDLVAMHLAEITSILCATDATVHYSLEMDMAFYLETNAFAANLVLQRPAENLPLLDKALVLAQVHVMDANPHGLQWTVKELAHVRCTRLPQVPHLQLLRIPRSEHVGKLVNLVGTVIRTGMVKMMDTRRIFQCTTCNGRFGVPVECEIGYTAVKPVNCGVRVATAPGVFESNDCEGKKFKEIQVEAGSNPADCKDYQEIKVQEQVTKLALGTIPRSILILLEDDLADTCKPGDDVSIVGTVTRRWQNLTQGDRTETEIVLVANHVRVHNEQRSNLLLTDDLKAFFNAFWADALTHGRAMDARNHIVSSFSPKIVGLSLVKLAVMLVLCGGVSKVDKSGMKMRGDSHILLVGDPGTGKSQFLRYAARISPRSVLTTGIGSTSAGLTVSAVKDSGEWQLEAGALVLADRGLCCVDEFGSIKEQDKTAIHEAMEQQTISVAKAGLVCKLNTRCSILAATNPKGKYNPNQSMEVNVALGSPLLSRFDLILTLLDTQNVDWDRRVSSFILGLTDAVTEGTTTEDAPLKLWDADKLQAYLTYVKSRFHPVLTEPANEILKRYYQIQRGSDLRNAARTTIRLLESMIRLAQSHARLMFREEVTVQDAVCALMLVEISINSTGLDGVQSTLHSTFSEDGDDEYAAKGTSCAEAVTMATWTGTPDSTNPIFFEVPTDAQMYGFHGIAMVVIALSMCGSVFMVVDSVRRGKHETLS
ncbi:MCM2/3/5 family-domain-containing protein [Chytriomyces sp. MP71]|nr:MCM2/3/5 family-domain-containing protein [Chytriomyces sp. MP71]